MSDTLRINAILQANLANIETASATNEIIAAVQMFARSLTDEGKKLERELAAYRDALELIRDNGGTTTDEGMTCNGSWCAEQARRALEKTK